MTTMDRRQALKAIASLGTASVFGPVLAACNTPATAAARDKLNIGLILPRSGPLQRLGDQMNTGLKVYLDSNRQALGGVPVTVTLIDEGATSATAVSGVNNALDDDNITVLVGVANSSTLTALASTIENARVPLLATGASPTSLGIPYKFIWRTSYVAGEAGTAMATYLASKGKGLKMIVIDDGTADGRSETKSFVLAMATADLSHQQISTPKITADQLAQVTAYRPDAVFAACSGQAAVDLVDAYRSGRISAPLYGPGSLTEGATALGTLLDVESDNALGVYTTMNYAPDLDNPQNQAFAASYYSATHPSVAPTTLAMTTYDAATVLDTVIPLVKGDITRTSLAAALRSRTQFSSPRGAWEFNDQATPRQRWYLRQVRRDGLVLQNSAIQAIDMLN